VLKNVSATPHITITKFSSTRADFDLPQKITVTGVTLLCYFFRQEKGKKTKNKLHSLFPTCTAVILVCQNQQVLVFFLQNIGESY